MLSVFKNISIYTGVSVITGSISFLLLPILTTYLSTEDYGMLSIFNAVVRFLAVFITLGMGQVLYVELIKNRERFRRYLWGFIKTSVIATSTLTSLIVVGIYFTNDFFGIPYIYALFLPITALFVAYYEIFTTLLIYLKKSKTYVLYALGKYAIEIFFIILLIVVLNFDWKGRILALIIALTIILLFAYSFLIRNKLLHRESKLIVSKYAVNLTKKGSPLIFMTLSVMIINLSDRFFIEHNNGISETGIYGVAYAIAGIMLIIISALVSSIRPMIYEKLTDYKVNKKNIFKLGFLYHGLLLVAASGLIVVTPLLFEWLIHPKFNAAIPYTYYLIIGLFFWGSYNFFISFLLYHNKNKTNAVIAITGIVLNLTLNYILILEYGPIGAATATMLTYFLLSIITYTYRLILIK